MVSLSNLLLVLVVASVQQHFVSTKELTEEEINAKYSFHKNPETIGMTSVVHNGKEIATGKKVAMKVERESYNYFANEMSAYRDIEQHGNLLQHHIVNVLDEGTYGGQKAMIMTRLGMDLDAFLQMWEWRLVRQVAIDVITAMEFLHKAGYIHGDIYRGNISFGHNKKLSNENETSRYEIYLFDLGWAAKYKELRTGRSPATDIEALGELLFGLFRANGPSKENWLKPEKIVKHCKKNKIDDENQQNAFVQFYGLLDAFSKEPDDGTAFEYYEKFRNCWKECGYIE